MAIYSVPMLNSRSIIPEEINHVNKPVLDEIVECASAVLPSNSVLLIIVLAASACCFLLTYYCWLQLEKVQPTSEKLAEDIARPMAWPLRFLGFLLDDLLLPFTGKLWDISDPDALLKEGADNAGLPLEDYSPLVVEAIRKFCTSLQTDKVETNWVGRKNLHFIITTGLTQYLLLHKYAKEENPSSIQATTLNKPLIVTGLPRSGTTYLHRLLVEAISTKAMPIPFWRHFLPCMPPGGALAGLSSLLKTDLRLAFINLNFYGWKYVANNYGMDSMHLIRPNLPDECHFSLRMAGASFVLWNMAPVYSFCSWLLDEKASGPHVRHAYETYRLALQVAQLQNPNQRLVLKCPTHTLHMEVLREVIPEAVVVVTHRDPCKTSVSYCSMNIRTQVAGCNNVDWKRSIQMNLKKDVLSSQALVAYCRSTTTTDSNSSNHTMFHVSYKQLVSEPIALVKEISKSLDIPMLLEGDEGLEETLQAFVTRNRQHSHGIHRYSCEGMELKEEEIREAFSLYTTKMKQYL